MKFQEEKDLLGLRFVTFYSSNLELMSACKRKERPNALIRTDLASETTGLDFGMN
jgi:hypothetical protein